MADASMTAVRIHTTGGPEVLVHEEVPRPEPGPGDVLVRVHATCFNPPDWYARIGFANIPAPRRPELPLPYTLGTDVSGVVAQVGPGVTDLRVGDAVFGLVRFPGSPDNGGRTYAEYTTAPAGELARKPDGIDHLQAAGVPMAGLTAYQYLFDLIDLRPDTTILVNGAAGGVGHFAVQLARSAGARVIAVASGRHEAFLRDLGVDEYVDYTTTDVGTAAHDVDVVLDTFGGPNAHRLVPTLRRGGVLSPVFFGDYHDDEVAARELDVRAGQVHSDGRQMAVLADLLATGRLRVGIDSVFALADAAAAHTRAERGHIQGKIVLRVV